MKVEDIQVTNGWLLIKPFTMMGMSEGGIELPLQKHEKPNKGLIVKMDLILEIDYGFRVGDTAIFSKFAGNTIKIDDVDYLWLRATDLLGYVRSESSLKSVA
ncbi:MAG: co-chaperone GroES [Gammaproteobacteria bacterium]|nr:co-chaperone GroES [Gammaproteobacteria bacterium]